MMGTTSFSTITTCDTARIIRTVTVAMGKKGMTINGKGWSVTGCVCVIIFTEVRARSPKVSETRLPGNAAVALDLACCHGSL